MATNDAIRSLQAQFNHTPEQVAELRVEMTTLAANEAVTELQRILELGIGVRFTDEQRSDLVAGLYDAVAAMGLV